MLVAASRRSSSRTWCSEGRREVERAEAAHGVRHRCIDEVVERLVAEDLEHPRLLVVGGPHVTAEELLEGLECLDSVAWTLCAHGDLLTCSARSRGTVGRPPRSVTGPESLTATCTASTFGADAPARPLSRVASPKRYVGLRVSRGELLLRRPLDCVLRGLWRSGSNGVFSCGAHTTAPARQSGPGVRRTIRSPRGQATWGAGRTGRSALGRAGRQ